MTGNGPPSVHNNVFYHFYSNSVERHFCLVLLVGVHVVFGTLWLKNMIEFIKIIICAFVVDCLLSILVLLFTLGEDPRKHFHLYLVLLILHVYCTVLLLVFAVQYSVNGGVLSLALISTVLYAGVSIATVIHELRHHCNNQGGQKWQTSLNMVQVV